MTATRTTPTLAPTGSASPDAAARVDAADAHPFVARVKEYVRDVLRPNALATDAQGVTRERIGELADLGLLNHLAPVDFGGAALDRDADRRLHELLSSGCFNTWLVWAQHAPMVGRLGAVVAEGREPSGLTASVLRGELLVGAAISDVRRYPTQYIAATRVDGGWTFRGTVSWVSGWGLNSALTVAAIEPATEQVVTGLVTVGAGTVATPLPLSAVGGSRTERVSLHDVFLPDAHVVSTQSLAQWRRGDLGTASDGRAHHFGLARTVLEELEDSPDPLVREVAATWRPRVEAIRRTAYELSDEAERAGGGDHRLAERLSNKAASGEALATLTRALVIARAGRGLAGDDTAQLYARSALFVLVQGQTKDVRTAQLARLTH